MEALDVVAVAVDLVGLDQVHEDEPRFQRADQLGCHRDAGGVGGAGVVDVDPDAGEQVVDLADAVHGHAGVLKLLQIRAAGWHQRVVVPALGPAECAGRTLERPGDHAAYGVLAGHHPPRRLAGRIQLGLRDPIDVGRDLEH